MSVACEQSKPTAERGARHQAVRHQPARGGSVRGSPRLASPYLAGAPHPLHGPHACTVDSQEDTVDPASRVMTASGATVARPTCVGETHTDHRKVDPRKCCVPHTASLARVVTTPPQVDSTQSC